MSIDFDHCPNVWYDLAPSYVGHGRVELINPDLVLQGPAAFQFDELEGGHTAIQIETADPAEDLLNRWWGASAGTISTRHLDRYKTLSITSETGIYQASHRLYESRSTIGTHPSIELRALGARYAPSPAGNAQYWVLPLYNMVSDGFSAMPRPQVEDIAKHPLRIFSTPDIPSGLSGVAAQEAGFRANLKNTVIPFTFRTRLGFIESLPDYRERLERLRRGEATHLVTALMVCEAGSDDVDPVDHTTWFPVDILNVLSLATGTRVGAPWIEFRDEQAKLCRRVHMSFGSAPFQPSHGAILEAVQPNTGYLLTQALASPDIAANPVRIVLTHVINAGRRRRSIDEQFVTLCRGYEALMRHFGLATQDLAGEIGEPTRSAVRTCLAQAEADIRALAGTLTDVQELPILNRIASRTRGASQTDRNFGFAVADLAKHFGLNDATVLQAYTSLGGARWPEQLSELRGAVVHEGAFDFTSGRHNLRETLRVCDHLHDMLLRIVLKWLGSQAPYHSPIFPAYRLLEMDWVTSTTPVDRLIVPPA